MIVQRSFVDESATVLAGKILSTNAQAVVVCGEEDAAVIDAITTVTARGIPVVTLVSDIPTSPRLTYVGIDHYSAGRTAAFFMQAMSGLPGRLLVLCHSLRYRAHAQRVSGFRDRINDRRARGSPSPRSSKGRMTDACPPGCSRTGCTASATLSASTMPAAQIAPSRMPWYRLNWRGGPSSSVMN